MDERERRAIDDLADPAAWAPAAAILLEGLGFTLIHSDRPGVTGGADLLVALRPTPTLRHFDPETVSLWVAAAGRGRASVISRGHLPPATEPVQWGHVHVTDRLGIENRFLTFGGELRTARVSPDLVVVDLRSPGPIVRWGGHSQGDDPLADEIGAFFGRLIVPIDFQPGAEAAVAATPPVVLYAAFLADADARLDRAGRHLEGRDPLAVWVEAEATRLRHADEGRTWAAGRDLLTAVGLG